MMGKLTALCLLLSLVFWTGACEDEPDRAWAKQANSVLDRRERAFNEQNLKLYMSAISEGYAGDGTGYTVVRERAENLFREIDAIRYTSSQRQLYERENGDVMAVQRYVMELDVGGKVRSRSGVERLYLSKQDQFKIIDGL